jgi:DNA-binding transcriptional LysR family regulator
LNKYLSIEHVNFLFKPQLFLRISRIIVTGVTMKTEWLEDFIAVSSEGSFSKAANLRHVAQPAFSRRIKLLEEWVDQTLFDRSEQPIQMTPAGRGFLPIAKSVMDQLNQGREEIHQAAKGERSLKFAATHTLSIFFFPEWFQSINVRHKEVSLSLVSDHMDSCTQALTHGNCHFLICLTHPDAKLGFDENLYQSKVIGFSSLKPVTSPDDNGDPAFTVPGTDKEPTKYLYFSSESALGQVVDSMLERQPEHNLVKHSSSPLAAALTSMAQKGFGVTWIPEMLAKTHIQKGTLMLAGDKSWNIPMEIRIFRSRAHLPKLAQYFWDLIEKAAPGAT